MFHFCNFNFKFYNFKNIQKKKKGRKEKVVGRSFHARRSEITVQRQLRVSQGPGLHPALLLTHYTTSGKLPMHSGSQVLHL